MYWFLKGLQKRVLFVSISKRKITQGSRQLPTPKSNWLYFLFLRPINTHFSSFFSSLFFSLGMQVSSTGPFSCNKRLLLFAVSSFFTTYYSSFSLHSPTERMFSRNYGCIAVQFCLIFRHFVTIAIRSNNKPYRVPDKRFYRLSLCMCVNGTRGQTHLTLIYAMNPFQCLYRTLWYVNCTTTYRYNSRTLSTLLLSICAV